MKEVVIPELYQVEAFEKVEPLDSGNYRKYSKFFYKQKEAEKYAEKCYIAFIHPIYQITKKGILNILEIKVNGFANDWDLERYQEEQKQKVIKVKKPKINKKD